MKKYKLLLTMVAVFGSMSVHAIGVSDVTNTQSMGENSAEALKVAAEETKLNYLKFDGSGSLPDATYKSFTLIGVDADTEGVNLGCNGVNLSKVVVDMKDQAQEMFGYIKQNALGFAANYLIFSNPTLYSLYQDMQKLYQEGYRQNIATCSTMRQLGTHDRELKKRAMDLCMSQGNPATKCNDGNYLKKFYSQAVAERKREIEGKPASDTSAPGKIVKSHQLIFSQVDFPAEEKGYFEKLFPQVIYKGNKKIYQSRKMTMKQVMRKKSTQYANALIKAVDAYSSASDSKQKGIMNALQALNKINKGATIPVDYIAALWRLKQQGKNDSQIDFKLQVASMADYMAISYGSYLVSLYDAGIRSAFSGGISSDTFRKDPNLKTRYSDALDLASNEVASVADKRKRILEARRAMKNILDLARQKASDTEESNNSYREIKDR